MTVTHPAPEQLLGIFNLRVKPDCIDRFRAAVAQILPASATEPGLLRYEYLQSRTDPTLFTFIDVYRDEAAFQIHLKMDHQARFGAAIADLLAGTPDGEFYTIHEIFQQA